MCNHKRGVSGAGHKHKHKHHQTPNPTNIFGNNPSAGLNPPIATGQDPNVGGNPINDPRVRGTPPAGDPRVSGQQTQSLQMMKPEQIYPYLMGMGQYNFADLFRSGQ